MIKAYSFTRFSTPAQEKGDSGRRQLAKAERYAQANGLTLDSTLTLKGVSAYKGKHRKKGALARFLERIEASEIERGSYLIVENIDRLSRENPWDAFPLMQQIINAGIIVVSLIDGIEYSLQALRDHPELMGTLQAVLAKGHRESRDKGDRLQEVWAEKRAEIEAGGRRKLTRQGPRWLDLIPDDPADPLTGDWQFNARLAVIHRIRDLFLDEGLGKEAIARRLNKEGVAPFRHGDGWGPSTVYELLRDRRLIGELQLHTTVGGNRRPIGEPIKGYFLAAISETDFYRIQSELANRDTGASKTRADKVPNIFTGIGKCICGRSMEYRDRQSRSSPASVYLTCSGNRRGHACSNAARFTYAALENVVLDWVTDIEVSDAQANKASVNAIKLAGKEAERDDTRRRLHAAFAKWEGEENDMLKTMLYASVQRYSAALPKIDAEIAELAETVRTTKRSVIDDKRAIVRRVREEIAVIEAQAAPLQKALAKAKKEEKPRWLADLEPIHAELYPLRAKLAAALRAVVDRVEFHPDNSFGVTIRGGLKLYTFEGGRFARAFDLSTVNPNGEDALLTFPQAAMIDEMKLSPLTRAGLRQTLAGLVEPMKG